MFAERVTAVSVDLHHTGDQIHWVDQELIDSRWDKRGEIYQR
jgi:hypothetical protein